MGEKRKKRVASRYRPYPMNASVPTAASSVACLVIVVCSFCLCHQLNRSDSDSSTLAKKSLFVRNSTERRSLRVKRVRIPEPDLMTLNSRVVGCPLPALRLVTEAPEVQL